MYAAEIKPRIREHSWIDKEYIINDEITPFFGDMRMNEIKPVDVVRWQNELIQYRNKDGEPYSPTYLRTINNQLAAIFNHPERYYDLPNNPVSKTTRMGSSKGSEMVFWTKEEYLKFSEAIMDESGARSRADPDSCHGSPCHGPCRSRSRTPSGTC